MRILTTLLLAAGLLAAQEAAPQPAPAPVQRESAIIQVKTLTGDSFDRLVKLLNVFETHITADSQLRTIVVYAPPDVITQVKKVVAELDQPGSQAALGHNIEVTLSFLRCGSAPATGAGRQPSLAELEGVIRQLQAVTNCTSPSLWDTVPMRMQEGKQSEQSQRLPNSGSDQAGRFTIAQIRMNPVAVGAKENQGRYVRFDRVNIGFRVPVATGPADSGQFQYVDLGINTAGDFFENQKTVLGKVADPQSETIFVVVALKILD